MALAACGKSERAAPGIKDPVVSGGVIPAETLQLVTAVIPTWDATSAQLRLWTRPDGKAPWKLALGPWPGVIGRTGAAWGMGRHGRGPFPNRPGPLKVEGDGKSPAGAFLLQGTYGVAATPPTSAGLPYQHVDANWQCVDDSASSHYNTIVDKRAVETDWKSAEDMMRPDPLYTWVVDVAHNPTRIPNGGSCIFLHVWSGADSTTVGCTAMEEPRLAQLIGTLSATKQPMFVLLPRAEYEALAPAWELPPPLGRLAGCTGRRSSSLTTSRPRPITRRRSPAMKPSCMAAS
ncbi:L,D-transpeptidase family protein [soil metagenome]